MDQGSATRANQNIETVAIIGGISFLSLLICLCLGGFGYLVHRQVLAATDASAAVATPTTTAAAQQPASGDAIIRDDFSDNKKNWQSRWSSGYVLVNEGHLFLSSDAGGQPALTHCQGCAPFSKQFYIQADLSTNQAIDETYGLVFNVQDNYNAYYLFEINAVQGRYDLYKKSHDLDGDVWMLRISRDSSLIKPFPKVNRLAVSFAKDVIELFINGSRVDSYADPGTELNSGLFGFFVDHAGFKLIVDNLYAYGH